jgi:hypothetical protein
MKHVKILVKIQLKIKSLQAKLPKYGNVETKS